MRMYSGSLLPNGMAREIGWSELINNYDEFAPAVKDLNTSRMTITFYNNSKISCRSGDNPDSLRGRKITKIILDEAAFIKEDIWQVVRPSLADSKGSATLISTPNGIGDWFHQIYVLDNEWSKYHWESSLNKDIMTPEEIEDLRAGMSQAQFDQEILAKFITRAGRVYSDFDDSNIIDDFILDKSKFDIYLGMDFGFANPSAICWMAVDRGTEDKVYQFDEHMSRIRRWMISLL